jgi:hypothetical protein
LVAAYQPAQAQESARPVALAVITGPQSPLSDVTVDDLRELYLRRGRLLPDGTRAVPINLPAGTTARRTFSLAVLGRAPEALATYWDRRFFEGVMPPVVLGSPDAIARYLISEPSALAYLPEDEVDDSMRVLAILEP